MKIGHVDPAGRRHDADLFGTFAALTRDEVASFPALRPHQRQPWHAFLVQIAALALHRAGRADLPTNAEDWRALLLGLTPDYPNGEAWRLVVDDWKKPALLQPPVKTAANKGDYKSIEATPDALDMLVTSKNHDLKGRRLAKAEDDDWLFALVTLQTYEGYSGRFNFGISRMNSGGGSRIALSVHPHGRHGIHFTRDTQLLLSVRHKILNSYPDLSDDGTCLLWLEAWDGTSTRSFEGLDPYYIEICRRVRLTAANGRIYAKRAGSTAKRIHTDQLCGVTGDPWAPIARDKQLRSYTPKPSGFGYHEISALLNPVKFKRPPLAEVTQNDVERGLSIVAAAVVRKGGVETGTEGYHERRVPVSKVARGLFNRLGGRVLDRTGGVAEARAGDAAALAKILRHALFVLHQGGPERARLDDRAAEAKLDRWLKLYDARVDVVFFDEAFWSEVADAEGGGDHRPAWRQRLRGIARNVLDEAAEAAPRTDARRVRAKARAFNVFERRAGDFVREVANAD